MKLITILLVDDHPVVRTGYRRLLENEPDMRIMAEAENGEKGYKLYQEHQPNVTILDINMPGIGGLETIRRIRAKNPAARILVFSMLKNVTLAQSTIKAGATGFLSKESGMMEMILAVRQVSLGRIYIESELASVLAVKVLCKDTSEDPLAMLTRREFQIFKLLAEGHSCVQIAELLTISPKTVSVHQINLMRKLKLHNITQLILLALSHNII